MVLEDFVFVNFPANIFTVAGKNILVAVPTNRAFACTIGADNCEVLDMGIPLSTLTITRWAFTKSANFIL